MKWVYCQEVVILVTVSSSKLLGDNFELAHWIMKREHVTIHVRDTRIDQFMFEFGRPLVLPPTPQITPAYERSKRTV